MTTIVVLFLMHFLVAIQDKGTGMVLLQVASSGDLYSIPSTTVSTVLSANFAVK